MYEKGQNHLRDYSHDQLKQKAELNLKFIDLKKEAALNCLSMELQKALKKEPFNLFLLSVNRRINNNKLNDVFVIKSIIVDIVMNFNKPYEILLNA